jgi:hypothetical protein
VNISNLQYPTTVGLGKLVVSFTVDYSGITAGSDYLVAGVTNSARTEWIAGSVITSNPDNCPPNTGTDALTASCAYQPAQAQGSENLAFSVTLNSTGTYSFSTAALIQYPGCSASGSWCTAAYQNSNPFSITLVDKFTLTVSIPDQVSVTLDGVPQGVGSTSSQLSPGTHVISIPDIVQLDSTSRLKFNGWSDGSNQTTKTFNLEKDSEIDATYVTQYLVTSTTDSTLQSGWYDRGTLVQFTVDNTQLVNEYRLLLGGFDGWYNASQLMTKSPSASFPVDGPLNLSDKWNYLPYIPPVLIVAIVAVILFFARRGNIPTPELPKLKMLRPNRSRKRTRRSKTKVETIAHGPERQVIGMAEIKEAESTESIAEPKKTPIFCRECGARIPRDSIFCEACGTNLT